MVLIWLNDICRPACINACGGDEKAGDALLSKMELNSEFKEITKKFCNPSTRAGQIEKVRELAKRLVSN
jgi:hypothetical protein